MTSDGQLRAFVERIERLEEEIRTLNDDKSDIYKEAKGSGYNVKVLRKVIAARRLGAAERQETDAIFDLYMSALEGEGRLTVQVFGGDPSRVRAHVEIVEVLPPHDPETGEITESEPGDLPGPLSPLAARGTDESAASLPHSSEPTSSPVETDKPDAVPPPAAPGALSEIPAGSHAAPSKRPIQGVPATDAGDEAEAPRGTTGHDRGASPMPGAVASASGALSEMPPAGPSVTHTDAGKSDGDRNPVDAALVTARRDGQSATGSRLNDERTAQGHRGVPRAGAHQTEPRSGGAAAGHRRSQEQEGLRALRREPPGVPAIPPSRPENEVLCRQSGSGPENEAGDNLDRDREVRTSVRELPRETPLGGAPARIGETAPFSESDVPAFLRPAPAKPAKMARDGCLEPECCGSYTRELCHKCRQAAASAEAA